MPFASASVALIAAKGAVTETLAVPLVVTCVPVMPLATAVDRATVPWLAVKTTVTLSAVGSEGSASDIPLATIVPLVGTVCWPGAVIAIDAVDANAAIGRRERPARDLSAGQSGVSGA